MCYVRESEADGKFTKSEPRDCLRCEIVHNLNAEDLQFITLLNESFGVLGRTAGRADSKETGVVAGLFPPVGEDSTINIVIEVYVLDLVLKS